MHAAPQPRLDQERAPLRSDTFQAIRVQQRLRDTPRSRERIVSTTCALQHTAAQIRCEHFPWGLPQRVRERHRDAIGLLAAGTRCAPRTKQPPRTMRRRNSLPQEVKVLRLSEKMRLVGGEQIDGDLRFTRMQSGLQQAEIFSVVGELVMPQSRREPPHDQRSFLIRQIDPGHAVNPRLDIVEFLVGNRQRTRFGVGKTTGRRRPGPNIKSLFHGT